jgi:hypothetical protein
MILVLLVVSAIALFLSFIYVHQNTLRISLSVIFAALLVTSIVFISRMMVNITGWSRRRPPPRNH